MCEAAITPNAFLLLVMYVRTTPPGTKKYMLATYCDQPSCEKRVTAYWMGFMSAPEEYVSVEIPT
jgi:hypothetical protein